MDTAPGLVKILVRVLKNIHIIKILAGISTNISKVRTVLIYKGRNSQEIIRSISICLM